MLKRIDDIRRVLDRQGVTFAAWKSLENITQAFEGKDDLDLLLLPEQRALAVESLRQLGFTPDLRSPGTIAPDLLVMRGIDPESGAWLMLHLHFACRFGSKKLKEYRFPHEREMLEQAVPLHGFPLIGPGHFLITRLLQAAVKGVDRDEHLQVLAAEFPSLPEDQQELAVSHLSRLMNIDVPELVRQVAETGCPALAPHASTLRRSLRLENPTGALPTGFGPPSPARHAWFSRRWPRNKLGRAVSITLAGHDGAGKSTTAEALADLLGRMSRTRVVYLGRNRWCAANRLLNRLRTKPGLRLFCGLLWPITSSLEIMTRLWAGKLWRALGFMVIHDRSLLDLKLKYAGRPRFQSWFPLLVSGLFSPGESDLRYLLVADPAVAAERCGGTPDIETISRLRQNYETLAAGFQVIDTTTGRDPQGVALDVALEVMGLCSGTKPDKPRSRRILATLPEILLARLRRPYVLAVTGPSGAGKSTLSGTLASRFGSSGRFLYIGENSKKVRFRIGLVERLKDRQSNPWAYRLFLVLMPLEMWLRALPLRFGSATPLLMMDRYAYRKVGRSPEVVWYNLATRLLLPQPDLLVLLGGDEQTIWDRKRKRTREAFQRDFEKSRRLYDSFPQERRLEIDVTALSQEESADSILERVLLDPRFAAKLFSRSKTNLKHGAAHFQTGSTHYKFSLTTLAQAEQARGKAMQEQALTTPLARHVPEAGFLSPGLLAAPRLVHPSESQIAAMVPNYLALTRSLKSGAENGLAGILDWNLLKRGMGESPRLEACQRVLARIPVRTTFAHRDFHESNLLLDADRQTMKLIDWGDARFDSTWIFDGLSLLAYKESNLTGCSLYDVLQRWGLTDPARAHAGTPYTEVAALIAPELTPEILAAYILDCMTIAFGKRNAAGQKSLRHKFDAHLRLAAWLCREG